MRQMYLRMKRSVAAIAVSSAVLLAGCSMVVTPKYVPPIKGYDTVSFSGLSVIVTNAEKDSTEYQIPNDKGQKLGIVTNRQAWSGKIVEGLASELARRGARVRADAPLALSIALPEITFLQTKNRYQFKIKVTVSSSRGWSKNYEALAETGSGVFESLDAMANRLAGLSVEEALKTMLGDAEFLAQLASKK